MSKIISWVVGVIGDQAGMMQMTQRLVPAQPPPPSFQPPVPPIPSPQKIWSAKAFLSSASARIASLQKYPLKRTSLISLAVAVILLAMLPLILHFCNVTPNPCGVFTTATSPPTPALIPLPTSGIGANGSGIDANGVGATYAPDGDLVGLSSGTVVFDRQRDNIEVQRKVRAAENIRQQDRKDAEYYLNLALDQDPSDAEAQIYLEDQKVLASHQPYITIVVPTALTGNAIVGGRDNLQGVYLAQKEYNDPRNKQLNGTLVLILVANSGSIDDYVSVTRVAQQIVLLAQNDPTFVGVMGWPRSQSALYALPLLTAHNIPMVSDLASSDNLAGKSFFRVPPNQRQGVVDAKYAEQTLNAKNIALFEDPNNQYSSTLAEDFKKQFTADGKSIAFTEYYTVGKPQTLPSCLQHALTHSPDLIYFSGYTEDIGTLLTALPTYTQFSHLQVLGGDALYELNYPSSALAAYNRLHFTAFAFFDEWDWSQIPKSQQPSFFKEYPKVFNPDNLTYPNPYGHTRASSDVILAYDATLALLKGYQEVLMGGKQSISPADLQEALTHTAFQGASEYIDLASPNEKPFVVLCVNSQNQLQIESVQGCLLGSCPLQDSVRKRSACAS